MPPPVFHAARSAAKILGPFPALAQYHCSMETAQEFSARAARLLADAKALSMKFGDDYGELNRWMAQAKQRRMTWVDGLAFAIGRMRDKAATTQALEQ